MGPRGVGNPPHSSLPPPRPPDPSQFKLKLQAHKEEVAARFSKLGQSLTTFAAEQEEFQRELREELRQLRLSYGEPSLPQPHSNPPTTTVSAPPPSSSAGTPSSATYCQSQLRKCQLPQPPLLLNCKPQSLTLDPKAPQALFHTSPLRTTPPSLPLSPVVKPSSISENIEPKFHSPTTLSTQAITKKGCMGVEQHDCVKPNANDHGNRMTPSYVAFTDTDVVNNQITINHINTVSDANRLIGRRFSDSSVQGDMNLWSFKVFPGPCDKPMINATYKGEEKQFAVEEILSMVLIEMREIQVIIEGLKIGKGHELEHCFCGVDKRVRDKGGGHTFHLGNNLKVIITMSHDPQYWKSLLNGFIWSVFKHRSEPNVHTGNALLNVNKGDFTYVMCLENWIERTVGNASKLSVRQAAKVSGNSEVLILDQETNFQQRVSYVEKAIGILKNNFGLSFASIALYYGDYEHKQLKFGLVLGLFVYTTIMQPEHEHVIGSNMNQFYNPNCGVKWVRVVHICNQPSNSSIEVIGFLIAVLELSHGRYDNFTWFLLLNLCSVLPTIDSNIFVIAVTKNRKDKKVLTLSHFVVMSDRRFKADILVFPKFGEYFVATVLLNKMEREDHLIAALAFLVKDNSGCINNGELEQSCKEFGQVWRYVQCINKFGQFKKHYGDMCFSTLLQERLNSTLSFNIYTAMLPKGFYIGSSFGAMEVIGVKNALLWDKVLTEETLIKSFSVHNFSSEAFKVNCEMINYSLQLGINPRAVTNNCSFKEFEMENLYELIIDDLIGQHCSMFLWIISAIVKPHLKLMFRVAKNFKPMGNLLSNALYDVGVTLITSISFNKARKFIMVMSNAVHEPCKTTYVQVLIEVSKTLQLVEDDITKLDGFFDNGPMFFPYIMSAPTPLRNSLKLSLEHSKQVKVFSLQVSHKKNICQQRCSYFAESKISQDAATHANTLNMRYRFSWKLLRYANTTILTKNMMVGPQYDLMNGSFSWVTVRKLKEVIRNAEQWIEESCMEYQVGQTVIKFSHPFLGETHELKFTLVKLKLMELISIFEIASDNEEQGTQYTKSCGGVDQSMKLSSHFEKWYQSNATAPFGSQCVLGKKAVAAIVTCGVIALAKQEESTWVCLLLLVYISLEKHEDMLYFKECGLLGSYFYGTLYWTSYCHSAHVYLLAQSLYETHRITKALYAAFW